ncbi:benzoate membrane transport protein [Roseovarius nanhaiticus]|uniref:Benzoate membrane transport protein n=1 Tax=Roseovarius nanhaiticus TaxID=573024 RepID=A0A1N7FFC1_9RHOB|nr:benzoate/H(+) symporter BenE family transporter [Roseovarius nanhaiticus]SEK55783.1 benzoate membrane transport protein [Roseovarius nanhaiticus]SIR99031.1 benzoate membrane transport protein [Roseovarius nanhaiticus]
MRISVIISALVAVLVGFGGSVAIILSAADALGASEGQKATWVTVLCLSMMATTAILSIRHRLPIVTAWSTPGAAVLAGVTATSMEVAAGAFVIAALMLIATGLIPALERAVARIPGEVASAMLAGVLFSFVAQAARVIPGAEALVLPLLALFFVVRAFSPIWAVLAVLAVGVPLAIGLGMAQPVWQGGLPPMALIRPEWNAGAVLGVAIPLYLVTMASQNLPGFAVLRAAGYPVPGRSILTVTGLASLVSAAWGAHSINLAAITASICTGPDAHPDPAKRWLTGPVYAAGYTAIAVVAMPLVLLFASFPPALIAVVAGAALLGPFIGSLSGALASGRHAAPAAVTFVVTASGLSLMGVGAAFWGLVAGLGLVAVEAARDRLRRG